MVNALGIRERIDSLRTTIERNTYQRFTASFPELTETHSRIDQSRHFDDIGFHLRFLAESVAVGEPELFIAYVRWLKSLYAHLEIDEAAIFAGIDVLEEEIRNHLEPEEWELLRPMVAAGKRAIELPLTIERSFVAKSTAIGRSARRYLDLLLDANRREALEVIIGLVEEGVPVRTIYLEVLQPVQLEVGRLWQSGSLSVAQEHYVTAATQLAMAQLYRYIFTGEAKDRTLVVACVSGELHEIGARMVADLFEMSGWDSYYLGANTPAESVVSSVESANADMLAISATMTFHVSRVAEIISLARNRLGASCPPIIVGGYPFNVAPNLWRRIGADGHAEDAQEAVTLGDQLVS